MSTGATMAETPKQGPRELGSKCWCHREGDVLNNLQNYNQGVARGLGRPRDGQEPSVNGLCFPRGQVEDACYKAQNRRL